MDYLVTILAERGRERARDDKCEVSSKHKST